MYMLLAMFFGFGLHEVLGKVSATGRRWLITVVLITTLWNPLVYLGAYYVLSQQGIFKSLVRNKPYRDGYETWFLPWGVGEAHQEKLNEEINRLAGDDGLVLVTESMARYGIFYAHERGVIPVGVEIEFVMPKLQTKSLNSAWRTRLKKHLKHDRRVVLVPRDRDNPRLFSEDVTWRREGDLYILEHITTMPGTRMAE
jgi:hypothetical protein